MIKNEFIDGIHAVYKFIAIMPPHGKEKNSGLNLFFSLLRWSWKYVLKEVF